MRRLAFLLLLLSAGCGSYEDDLYKICNAHRLSGTDPAGGLSTAAPWLAENLKTKKAVEMLRLAGEYSSVDQLRAEATTHGVVPCPLLDPKPVPGVSPVTATTSH